MHNSMSVERSAGDWAVAFPMDGRGGWRRASHSVWAGSATDSQASVPPGNTGSSCLSEAAPCCFLAIPPRLTNTQFSEAELRAIVEEAEAAGGWTGDGGLG